MGAKSMNEVQDIENNLIDIFNTPRGAQMLDELETRPNNVFGIDLTEAGVANSDHPGLSNLIHVDPDFHPTIQTTAGPQVADTLRIIAHELGHAAFGTSDNGMDNIRLNENPVVKALGYPARTAYPAVQGP